MWNRLARMRTSGTETFVSIAVGWAVEFRLI